MPGQSRDVQRGNRNQGGWRQRRGPARKCGGNLVGNIVGILLEKRSYVVVDYFDF